jgi:hypothetical protein
MRDFLRALWGYFRYAGPLSVALLAVLLASPAGARNFKTTLGVNPAPPVVGQANTFSGCGYDPSAWFKAYVIWPVGDRDWTGYDFNSVTDSDGCLSEQWTPTVAGTTRIYIYQRVNSHANSIETVRGFTELVVAEP